MSTFSGIVHEFPAIRIDYFRSHPGKKPPSACFLSHIHSDHLLGLESLKMPFVYCSAATKRILLRMEKYPHRINFQKGILEARKQTYKHLKRILRELPLQTPIELELEPKTTIRVTLFDANHCPGAVMFLIEGNGKAILYTGDIRAEPWWVNSIVRSPMLIPYSCGHKSLDCIYLDTTFASHDDIYKEFPSKAEGLKQLLTKVSKCPKSSVFYFRAWTLGYEDVWILLSSLLGSRVHVEDYQMQLFASLTENACSIDQGAALAGCTVGNQIQPGCLTTDSNVSIHSCEPGMECHAELSKKSNVVWITPIISTLRDGTEVAEIGVGGGGGDLYQLSELEIAEEAAMKALRLFCASTVKDKSTLQRLEEAFEKSKSDDIFRMPLEGLGLDLDQEIPLSQFISLVSAKNRIPADQTGQMVEKKDRGQRDQQRIVHFPYSRHSSFSELRNLVSSLQPKDICPCTVDIPSWSEELTMESLFGDLCTTRIFRHDKEIRDIAKKTQPTQESSHSRKRKRPDYDSQETASQGSASDELYRSAQMGVPDAEEGLHDAEGAAAKSSDRDGIEVIMIGNESSSSEPDEYDDDDAENTSDISVPDEAFDSQGLQTDLRWHGGMKGNEGVTARSKTASRFENHTARLFAYRAAKSYLANENTENWDDLHLRSMGWKGHTEDEVLL